MSIALIPINNGLLEYRRLSYDPGQLKAYAVGAANTNPDASPNDISPHSAPISGVISSIATATATTTATSSPPLNSDQSFSFTFTLSGFNSVTPPASRISTSPSYTNKLGPSESLIIYTPNSETNSIVTGANIIYNANGATPAAITTTVKGVATTSARSTITSVKVFSASKSPTSSTSATNTPAAPVASPLKASAAPSTPSRSGNGGLASSLRVLGRYFVFCLVGDLFWGERLRFMHALITTV